MPREHLSRARDRGLLRARHAMNRGAALNDRVMRQVDDRWRSLRGLGTAHTPAPVTDPIAARYARRDARPALIAFWVAITVLALVATAMNLSLPMINSA